MKLAIISHTPHYFKNGQIVGWGATVREINHLATIFDEIYHVAVLHEGEAPASSLPYMANNVHFVPLQPSGGSSLLDKWSVLTGAPKAIQTAREVLTRVDVFQFRAPTGMGVYLIPYLSWFAQKPGWFKYAGNWVQPNPPLGYRLQKLCLTRFNRRPVTINGHWPNQPAHCLSFENPCLDEADIAAGKVALAQKDFSGKLDFCFVGRLEDAKGVRRMLEAFRSVSSERIGAIHLVGDGPQRREYEQLAANLPYQILFHGFLDRTAINSIYAQSHIFLLPSDSEGFPKVLAEAMSFGCVPLVSDVSSIPQYIQDGKNGFLWRIAETDFEFFFKGWIMQVSNFNLPDIASRAQSGIYKFTYQFYMMRIKEEIIPSKLH